MSLNTNSLHIDKDYSVYVPTNNLQYKYALDITADYVDLYDVPQLESNHTYTYIRVFFDRPGLIDYRTRSTGSMYTTTTLKPVNVSDDFFARNDSMPICVCTMCLMVIFVWVFNSITEMFNKGGLFHIC